MKLTRDLNFRIKGEHCTGQLRVGDVVWLEEKKRWVCYWSLAYVHPEEGHFYGEDALQAWTRTLDFISSHIRGNEADGLKVWWQYEGDHGGLTFPQCERGAVEGYTPIKDI